MIEALYPNALDSGVSVTEFWHLTIREIADIVESRRRVLDTEEKRAISRNFGLATLIANRIGYAFSSEKDRSNYDLIQPWQMYPGLFENEDAVALRRQAEFENYKADRLAAIRRWNGRRKDITNGTDARDLEGGTASGRQERDAEAEAGEQGNIAAQ